MRTFRPFRCFLQNESGAALVYVLIALPVLVGVLGLSLDLTRGLALNTELQDLADASALAGAAELDRRPGAIARATEAATDYVSNLPSASGDAEPEFQILQPPEFYDFGCIPAAFASCTQTTDDAQAAYIRVTATPRSAPSIFIRVLADEDDIVTVAHAIAGSFQVACNVAPLMMCEPQANLLRPGMMYRAVQSGATLGPGAFAFLDPPPDVDLGITGGGANITQHLIATSTSGICFIDYSTIDPGASTGPVRVGFNTRFDMYPSGGTIGTNKSKYPPAPNVTKGKGPPPPPDGVCSSDLSPTRGLKPLPMDNCFLNDTCTGDRLGEQDNWDIDQYLTINHSTKGLTNEQMAEQIDTIDECENDPDPNCTSFPTRFETYLWELGIADEYATPASNLPNMPVAAEATITESGEPCEPPGLPLRRVMYIAVAPDCDGITGNATEAFQSSRYGKFFLTRPMEQTNNDVYENVVEFETLDNANSIVMEFVQWEEPGPASQVLRKIVQLYR